MGRPKKYQKHKIEIQHRDGRRRPIKINGQRMMKFFMALLKAYQAIPNPEEQRRIHKAIGIIQEL